MLFVLNLSSGNIMSFLKKVCGNSGLIYYSWLLAGLALSIWCSFVFMWLLLLFSVGVIYAWAVIVSAMLRSIFITVKVLYICASCSFFFPVSLSSIDGCFFWFLGRWWAKVYILWQPGNLLTVYYRDAVMARLLWLRATCVSPAGFVDYYYDLGIDAFLM